jgi:5,10-methylene-tetrahydrofolate dehydrogenase/methenyl tetrahydrofolate cyclohydrolase
MLLEDLKKYCKNKNIIIVGNSSNLLNKENGQFIDSHSIVIRVNHGYPIKTDYRKNIGNKTDIYCVSISRTDIVNNILKNSNFKFILRLTSFNSDLNQTSVIYGNRLEYTELKKKFGGYKPSTGSVLINFIIKNIEFKHLNLIGFDFFENESRFKKNKLGSFLYKEHDTQFEKNFILSCLEHKNVSLIR